jgi:hypothetical protein
MHTELEEIEDGIWEACEAPEDGNIPKLSLVAVVYHKAASSNDILAAYLVRSLYRRDSNTN